MSDRMVRLAKPRPCEVDGCGKDTFWFFAREVDPVAICIEDMRAMAAMNSDNAEVFASALDEADLDQWLGSENTDFADAVRDVWKSLPS